MFSTHLSLYKKYVQARAHLDSYTDNFMNSFASSGNSRQKMFVYNTIVSWIDIIAFDMFEPKVVTGVSPRDLVLSIVPLPSTPNALMNIFITTDTGIRECLGTLKNNVFTIEEHNSITVSYNSILDKTTFKFSPGSTYNGSFISVSRGSIAGNNKISRGVDALTKFLNLTDAELTQTDITLDKIAIEFGITYSDKEYNFIQGSLSKKQIKGEKLLASKNLELTAEDGSPLEV